MIEKAVYADTPQNRKLGRVGQEYHRGSGKKEGGAAPEPKHMTSHEESKKSSKISTTEDAAAFLKENADKWFDYQYGDLDDEKLEAKFDAANKYIKNFKQFDWSDEEEADEYKDKMERKGYKVVDVSGSDTYVLAVLKKSKKKV